MTTFMDSEAFHAWAATQPEPEVVTDPWASEIDSAVQKAQRIHAEGRPLRILSLGAGVQSTALLILSARGLIPKLDFAIFADTGWEPREVYEHLDRLEREVAVPAGITILRVSTGNIREDALNVDKRVAMIPLFTRGSCPMCHGAKSVRGVEINLDEAPAEDAPRWFLRLLDKLRDSGQIGMAIYDGACPRCNGTGILLGRTRRQCTRDYKLVPIGRAVRALCGARPNVNGIPGQPPKGVQVEQWIGFSIDEADRALDAKSPSYVTIKFPLMESKLSRDDCMAVNIEAGFPETEKSACIGCPNHRNEYWRWQRDNRPADHADACDFDEAIRGGSPRATARGHALRGQAFLHESRVPLAQAPIGHVTRGEGQRRQLDMLGVLSVEGVVTAMRAGVPVHGCGPYSMCDTEDDDEAIDMEDDELDGPEGGPGGGEVLALGVSTPRTINVTAGGLF